MFITAVGGNYEVFTFEQFYVIASKYLQSPDKHNYRNNFEIGILNKYIVNIIKSIYETKLFLQDVHIVLQLVDHCIYHRNVLR